MIQIFGPCNPRSTVTFKNGEATVLSSAALISCATTLGEAIHDYCQAFEIEIEPTDLYGEKFFAVTTSGHRFEGAIYDPHVLRGAEEICPKQDLSFQLLENDILDLGGPLAC